MNEYDGKIFERAIRLDPLLWLNSKKKKAAEVLPRLHLQREDIQDAKERLDRFAPYITKAFPETGNGIIESPLREGLHLQRELELIYGKPIGGRLYLKCDNELEVAGSIKARGGIYEVLKHAEKLVLEEGLLSPDENYAKLLTPEYRKFFSRYRIAVGSTGNLGMSIGIISAKLGFEVTVHMSRDAKEWKKKILRSRSVRIVEYDDDYSKAVEEGRRQCEEDPRAYFIDDENSEDLFLGYSVAALRLRDQLKKEAITVDPAHPLYVFLPCGVGGAPGGITFGLKHVFGDAVRCYFVEPTHAPCMLLGMLKDDSAIRVGDYGIDNVTEADGLAVGSPSNLVLGLMHELLDGIYTIGDAELYRLLAMLKDCQQVKAEPSSTSSLYGPTLIDMPETSTSIAWLTGGLFLPDEMYRDMYDRGKALLKR